MPRRLFYASSMALYNRARDVARGRAARDLRGRTMNIITNTINDYSFNGNTLDFMASFFSYCNDRTTFGVPRMVGPLDNDMSVEFGILTLQVSDIAAETGFSDKYIYTIEETDEQYTVHVTSYIYDNDFEETCPAVDYILTFDISDPHELERLCNYIGVTFEPSYFN